MSVATRLGSRCSGWVEGWIRRFDPEQRTEIYRNAVATTHRFLPPGSPALIRSKQEMATKLFQAGKRDEALILQAGAYEALRRRFGSSHSATLAPRVQLAAMLAENGRFEDAELHLREVTDQFHNLPDRDPEWAWRANCWLGHVLIRRQRYDEAREVLDAALAASQAELGEEHKTTLLIAQNFVEALVRCGELGRAIDVQRYVVEVSTIAKGRDDAATLVSRWYLASYLHASGNDAEAGVVAGAVLEDMGAALGEEHPDTTAVKELLCEIRGRLGSA